MRRLLVLATFLVIPAVTVAQQAAAPPTSSSAQPKAQRMASDAVMALVAKGQVFFLDVREPKELEELGTFCGLGDYKGKKPKVFPKVKPDP